MRTRLSDRSLRAKVTVPTILAVAIIALTCTRYVAAATLYRLTDLGGLPDGNGGSNGQGINASAQVVGLSSAANSGTHAFRWSAEQGMEDLGEMPGGLNLSIAFALNDLGQVVGESVGSSGRRAYLWTSTGGMQDLGTLNAGENFSTAYDVNNNTEVVGWSGPSSAQHAFKWTSAGGMQDLGTLPGDEASEAWGLNDAGVVVGVSRVNHMPTPVRWTNDGAIEELGDLPGGTSSGLARRINEAGHIVGFSNTDTGNHAFLWTPTSGMEDLGTLAGEGHTSAATGINNLGEVVGSNSIVKSPGTHYHAFLWTREAGMRDLNDLLDLSGAGWTLYEAYDINDAGQVVGWAFDPQGHQRAFLLTPVPEPSTLVLATIAAVIFAGHRVRALGKSKRACEDADQR